MADAYVVLNEKKEEVISPVSSPSPPPPEERTQGVKARKDEEEEDKYDDVVVPVGMTLLAKWIEDEDDKLFLVGTLIQRFVTDLVEKFAIRINEATPPEGAIEERRARPIKHKGTLPDGIKPIGSSITSNVRLPLMLSQEESISYPFKIVRATLKFEYSTTTIKETHTQVRPSLLEPIDQEHFREFFVLKHHTKPDADKNLPPEQTYEEDEFDRSTILDTVHPIPQFKFSKEKKGKTVYFPKCDFQWVMTSSYVKPLISTVLPALVLLVLQWINWYQTLYTEASTDTYLTNAITIILALVVVVPNMSDKGSSLRNNVTSIDYMISFFFLGTALSAYPDSTVALIGIIITSLSLLFPTTAAGKYFSTVARVKSHSIKLKHCLPVPGDKARGEDLNWDTVKVRTEEMNGWLFK
jgi:hypothetical protein